MKQKPFLWVSTSSSAASRTYHTARTLNVLSKLLSACPVSTSTTCNGRSDTYFDTRVQPRWGVSLSLSLSLSQPLEDKKKCSTANLKSLAGVVRRVTNSSTTRNRIVRVTGNRVPLVCFLARSKRKIFGEHHCFGTTAFAAKPLYVCFWYVRYVSYTVGWWPALLLAFGFRRSHVRLPSPKRIGSSGPKRALRHGSMRNS